MKKEKADLERLLNSLIEKGWKPYGKSIAELTETEKNVRLLTSLSSGLWQFVCEEGLVEYNEMKRVEYMHQGNKDYEQREYYNGWNDGSPKYEYRLIESSLKDENELENFLLSNIKVEG